MKTQLKQTLVYLGLLAATSFISGARAAEYGPWQSFQTFTRLDYRVKRCEFNDYAHKFEWHVEFRNRYPTQIHFNFELAEDGAPRPRLTNRTALRPGQEGKVMGDSGATWSLLTSAIRIPPVSGTCLLQNDMKQTIHRLTWRFGAKN